MARARRQVRKQRGEMIAYLCKFYGYTPEQVRGFPRSDLDILVEYIPVYNKMRAKQGF